MALRRLALTPLVALLTPAGVADARSAWQPCDQGRLSCARVSAPLDPTGRAAGRVSLFVERYALTPHPTGTIVALAGGPGQSALSLFARFRNDFQGLLGTRALVIFDERGIGRSGQLSCQVPAGRDISGPLVGACARTLGGPARYDSTSDTVADLEAIRRVLRLSRIDLYGVSYGTFPATQYARRYPSHVAHLVLDSSLPLDGEPEVNLDSFASIRRQLGSICAAACQSLDPAGALHELLTRLPLKDTDGLALSRASAGRLVRNVFNAADLDPFVRAGIPTALRLAANGERPALVRLGDLAVASETIQARAGAAPPTRHGPPRTVAAAAEPLATLCADERFVWSARDSLAVRRAKVKRQRSRLSPAALAPFAPTVALSGPVIADCERWPYSGADPPREPGRPPHVPTLILSGDDDVRTSLEQARALRSELPGATLLEVPGVGHAVLASDHTGCARRAVNAFLTSDGVPPCPPLPPRPFDPVAPASYAALAPGAPLAGEPGEVLAASVLTLRHDVDFVIPYGSPGFAFAGTAGGSLLLSRATVALIKISYIRSVALTGTLKLGRSFEAGRLAVSVHGRPYGALRLAAGGTIAGTLGGRAFKLPTLARQAIDAAHGLDFAGQLG